MTNSVPPSLSALDDIHSFWSEKWSGPKLGWHLNQVNPHLEKYIDPWLDGGTGTNDGTSSIFVPLCGKSVDLAYLASCPKVSRVVGIDIVRDAAEQFASEHPDLAMSVYSANDKDSNICEDDGAGQSCEAAGDTSGKESAFASMSFFRGKGITFPLGDLFDFMHMSSDKRFNFISSGDSDNSQFDAIYDRGSMVAIEPSRRQDYVTLLGSMLRSGGSILLITIDKRQVLQEEAKSKGPPFSIDEIQVRELYGGQGWVESISLLEEKNEIETDADRERWGQRGVSEAYELVFIVRKK